MRYLLGLAFAASLAAQIGPWSDISVSSQGVGFRATITVTQYCVSGDTRPLCTTGSKPQLYREQTGTQNLSNPFLSQNNGFFQFFASIGWYDILVSGLGITNYSYRVYISDGSAALSGAASGDLCGTYPAPIVCGLRGRALPGSAPTQSGAVPSFNTSTNQFDWRVPLYVLGAANSDVVGTYPTLTVQKIWNRSIYNAVGPTSGQTLVYRTSGAIGAGWYYEAPSFNSSSVNGINFSLCLGVECTIASNVTNPYVVVANTVSLSKCFISARIPPTTQNLIIDILKNNVSIFSSGNANKMNLTPSGGIETKTVSSSGVEGDIYTINILQTGLGFAGQDVTVSCKASFQ